MLHWRGRTGCSAQSGVRCGSSPLHLPNRLVPVLSNTGQDGAVLAALIALVAGPRATFRFAGQVLLGLLFVLLLVALVLVGQALVGR